MWRWFLLYSKLSLHTTPIKSMSVPAERLQAPKDFENLSSDSSPTCFYAATLPCEHEAVFRAHCRPCILGGSWVVISGVISPLLWVISIVTLLITLLITTHEPPSRGLTGLVL